ncbi:MAG: YdeI/OmpD-associated family protein [Bacteroidales bacterium]|nr:YdeI/OmpD-associated family protein [Bacteroidales bacterium]MBN2819923.1 YdeI/OmpD-associated family protein [Bacteroidales bacterium]
MARMTTDVETYLTEGCGRCKFFSTPQCKVHTWHNELIELRRIVLECGLTEESKWGMPCYTYNNKNILILSAFKNFVSINFFKGSLLSDTEKILEKQTDNSRDAHIVKFTDVKKVLKLESILKAYIFEAIEVEKTGLKVETKKEMEPAPEELMNKFKEIPALKTAFEALTPGRQRGYILYFSQAKQSKTRESRIEKYVPKILNGKGLMD